MLCYIFYSIVEIETILSESGLHLFLLMTLWELIYFDETPSPTILLIICLNFHLYGTAWYENCITPTPKSH